MPLAALTRSLASSEYPSAMSDHRDPGQLLHQRMRIPSRVAQLGPEYDLRHAENQAVQPEQQGQSKCSDVRTGTEHDTERDGHQTAQDERSAHPRRLSALEGRKQLEEAADESPDSYDDDQHQRGDTRPDHRDEPGGDINQRQKQVADDRPRSTAA